MDNSTLTINIYKSTCLSVDEKMLVCQIKEGLSDFFYSSIQKKTICKVCVCNFTAVLTIEQKLMMILSRSGPRQNFSKLM